MHAPAFISTSEIVPIRKKSRFLDFLIKASPNTQQNKIQIKIPKVPTIVYLLIIFYYI